MALLLSKHFVRGEAVGCLFNKKNPFRICLVCLELPLETLNEVHYSKVHHVSTGASAGSTLSCYARCFALRGWLCNCIFRLSQGQISLPGKLLTVVARMHLKMFRTEDGKDFRVWLIVAVFAAGEKKIGALSLCEEG